MGFISDLKELSAWLIGITSLLILLVFVYYRIKDDKVKT
jgi:hypothetical protein